MKAIETKYEGYKFRSRLEARWAVFFNAMRLKWEYEVEGFELSDGTWYLPDFKVHTPQNQVIWYEVKPEGVIDDEKFSRFAEDSHDDEGHYMNGPRTGLLSGDPLSHFSRSRVIEVDGRDHTYMDKQTNRICPRCGLIQEMSYYQFDRHSDGSVRVQCYHCDAETPFGGDGPVEKGVMKTRLTSHKGDILVESFSWKMFLMAVDRAATKARQAQF